MLDTAAALATQKTGAASIPIPTDVVVADDFSADAAAVIKPVSEVSDNELILDLGPETSAAFAEFLSGAGTVIWNGPVGVFEYDQFGEGTRVLAEAMLHRFFALPVPLQFPACPLHTTTCRRCARQQQ